MFCFNKRGEIASIPFCVGNGMSEKLLYKAGMGTFFSNCIVKDSIDDVRCVL